MSQITEYIIQINSLNYNKQCRYVKKKLLSVDSCDISCIIFFKKLNVILHNLPDYLAELDIKIAYPIKTLQQIAKLRNIDSYMSKKDTIYALIHSEPVIDEKKYIIDSVNEIPREINQIKLQLFNISPYMNKKEQRKMKKRLYDIGKMTKINRSLKNKLLKELNSISSDLKFVQKNMISDYRDENYANIDDIEYIFWDIDNYYTPMLTSSLFNKGHQRYHFRGDKMRNMSVMSYFDKIKPYLRVLIYENKAYEQKIQIDIGFNMVHISDNRRITHSSRSDNVICMPSSNANKILEQLLSSLYEKFNDDLQLSRESSSFVYESVEECNIHFHKKDLRRVTSFIDTPEWLKHKKATINTQNVNNVYCFMYAATTALYHSELGKNPGRISKKLDILVHCFNWHDITFPASYEDYTTFERLNSDVALNVLYVPFEEQNVCPEDISNRKFDIKDQIILLKISDEKGKWHFLALPSILDEDGVKRPYKSFSRLMEGISSNNHGDFYCLGCFSSFRTKTTLENHAALCKNNKFAKIDLPEKGSNFKRYKPGAKNEHCNICRF